jgi:acyl carrier protein
MNRPEVFQKIADSVRSTFRDPQIIVTDSTTADDIDGWDSLSHAILIFRIEKNCNVRIPTNVATGFKNIGELADHIVNLTERSAD